MSELKAYNSERIYWAVEQVEREAGDIATLHLDDNLFYLKSEADKVIAKLKEKLVEQMTLRVWAELQLRHQKYMRCLAMARWCKAGMYLSYECDFKREWWNKWHKRWLELAEKFKEAK